MTYHISDMHCDLLLFLNADPQRTAYQQEVRSSIPQLQAGGVKTQILAIYVPTEQGCAQWAANQLSIYQSLPSKYPELHFANQANDPHSIGIMHAIENASGICEENESIDLVFQRLKQMEKTVGMPLYMSLTWNTENRFGGGNFSKVGLKSDGKLLLDFLHQKQVAVDFSHASDALAYDVLNYIDQHSLKIQVIASHSNMRRQHDVPRNLPDDIAKEILRRGGIIGMNFIRSFIGPKDVPAEVSLLKHLEHVLKLGGEKQVCFGADFFYEGDIPEQFRKPVEEYFYPDFGDASVYGKVLGLYEKHLGLSFEILRGIASENFKFFIDRK